MGKFSVDQNIAKAKTIHTDFYTDSEVYSATKEKIFASSMFFVGQTDEFPEDDYAVPFYDALFNEPLFTVRKATNKFQCFSNVCTHRGNILVNEPGKLKAIRCGYHGRTFDMNGKMLLMPEFKEVENFPCANDDLTELPVFQWGKLLFSSLRKEVNPKMFFQEMMDRMVFFPMDQITYRADLSKTYTIDANWALYCENYLEGFHIPFVHPELSKVLDYADYETEIYYPYSSLQLGVAKKGDMCFDLPTTAQDYGRNIAAYYFWVFPNLMFNFYPWGLSLNIVEPIECGKTKVRFLTFMLDETKYEQGAGANLDKVEMEDEAIVNNVQKGVRSRFYNQGRYSVTKEKGTHHFHTLLSNFVEGIDPEKRVEQ
ncbi:MAG: Rieske 2Fe-2S domain-containing protein [Crocinitomicaceae bacterium]|nr:Rieske 2Fe-2S domain-containing protein [Crocinitomicaceae bacterium]